MVFVSYQEENVEEDIEEYINEGESCLDCLKKHALNENGYCKECAKEEGILR